MLQEYIPGSSETSWMFNGYFDGESRCLFGATGYKIRQYPLSGGFTTLGQLTVHDEIQAQVEAAITAAWDAPDPDPGTATRHVFAEDDG